MNPESNRRIALVLRWSVRALSLVVLAFWGVFIVAHLVGNGEPSTRPLNATDYIGLTMIGTWLAGFVVAWKHERVGGTASLLAYLVVAATNSNVLSWPLAPIPVTAILFLASGWMRARVNPRPDPSATG